MYSRKFFRGIFYFIVIIFLSSCVGSKLSKKGQLCEECLNLNEVGIEKINGFYHKDLWLKFRPFKTYKVNNADVKDSFYVSLNIKAKNKRKYELKAKLYRNDTIISEKKIKGKIKNGCFVSKSRIFPLGIPTILLFYYEYRMWLTITKDDNLFVHTKDYKTVWLLSVVARGERDENDEYFMRLK
jgi:hypothetical protein